MAGRYYDTGSTSGTPAPDCVAPAPDIGRKAVTWRTDDPGIDTAEQLGETSIRFGGVDVDPVERSEHA
ncbi:hypothetical protein [Nocardia gamkensis]|uniref:hypothetical protein n=1 Tax=Nocardia gamkensis TaxID=352869 RepID=UPI0037CAFA84